MFLRLTRHDQICAQYARERRVLCPTFSLSANSQVSYLTRIVRPPAQNPLWVSSEITSGWVRVPQPVPRSRPSLDAEAERLAPASRSTWPAASSRPPTLAPSTASTSISRHL